MASNKHNLNAAAREWLAARDVIAATILDWLPAFGNRPANDLAAAILSRLAANDPPILLDLGGIGADAIEACRAVVTTDWRSIEESKARRNALAKCADVVRRADAEGSVTYTMDESVTDEFLIADLEREIKLLAKKLERSRSALAVIHTWATFEYKGQPRGHALVPDEVASLCDRVLKETE